MSEEVKRSIYILMGEYEVIFKNILGVLITKYPDLKDNYSFTDSFDLLKYTRNKIKELLE